MTKEDVVCVCKCVSMMEYYSAIKKNEICSLQQHDMNGLEEHYAEVKKSEKDKYWVIPFICGI